MIHSAVQTVSRENKGNVILLTGGTGIAKRDVTNESVSALFEKDVVEFGELFRNA